MPRYFIDTDDGDLFVRDHEGIVLDSELIARDYAQDALPDMARDRLPSPSNRHTFAVGVRDETGAVFYRATLTLKGEWVERTNP